MEANTNNKGIIATLAPFKKDLTDLFPASELRISLRAKNTINDSTAIKLKVITSAVVTVVVVVVTVDIMYKQYPILHIYMLLFNPRSPIIYVKKIQISIIKLKKI